MSYNSIVAGAAFIRIAMDDASLRQGLKEAQKRVDGFAKSWEILKNKMALKGSDSFLYLSNAIGPMVSVLQTYSKFNDQMLMLKAISGATQSQIVGLEKYIRHLGATTAFTADQVAKGAVELSRMGFSTGELKAGLKPALDLVRATGQETFRLGEISAYAASALRIFGLKGKDFVDVCDVMAYAANASNADIDDLGEALKIAGPSARTVNEDLRDTAAALMLMSNAGIRGSLAGTSLRKIYQSLAAQSGKTAGLTQEQVEEGVRGIEAMRNLGVKIVDPDTGNLRKAAEVMNDLAAAVKQFKSGEKINFATEVFDLRGSLGALSMLNDPGLLNGFRQSLENVEGYAAKTAQEAEKGVGGVIRKLTSSFGDLILSLGKVVAEGLVPFMKAFTEVFVKVSGFINRNKTLIQFFGGLALAGLTLGSAMRVCALGMSILQKAFAPILGVTQKLDAFVAGITKVKKASEDFPGGANAVQNSEKIKELAQQKSDAIRIASEQRRHYMVLKNAAAEAQAVTVAEARKLAASKARIAELSSMRFDGQSIGEIAAMSPEAQTAKFSATRDYYGANNAREQIAELQQLQTGLAGQQKAYEASAVAASKAAQAAKMAKEETLKSILAAERSSKALIKEQAAQEFSSRTSQRRAGILNRLITRKNTLFSMRVKGAAIIWQTSLKEIAAAKAGAAASGIRAAGYYAEAAGAKIAAGATLILNGALKLLAANPITVALALVAIAWSAVTAAINGAFEATRKFQEQQKAATQKATENTEKGHKLRERERAQYRYLKELEKISKERRLTAEEIAKAEQIADGASFSYDIDSTHGRVKVSTAEEFKEHQKKTALEDITNELKIARKEAKALEKTINDLLSNDNENIEEDNLKTLERMREVQEQIIKLEKLKKRIDLGDTDAVVGKDIDFQKELESMTQKNATATKSLEDATKRLAEIEEAMARRRRTASEQRLHELQKEREEFEKLHKEKITALEGEIKKNKETIAANVDASPEAIEAQRKKVDRAAAKVAEYSKDKQAFLTRKQSDLQSKQKEIDYKKYEIFVWGKKSGNHTQYIATLKEQLKVLDIQKKAIEQRRFAGETDLQNANSSYSDAVRKLDDMKIRRKNAEDAGAKNMVKEEELLKQRADLAAKEKQNDEEQKRIQDEIAANIEKRRNFSNEIARQNKESDARHKADKTIEQHLREGNREAAINFLKSLVTTSLKKYQLARRNREQAFETFMEDGRLSETEDKKLLEFENKEKEANVRLQDYKNRLAEAQEAVSQARSASIGSFSLKALQGQLGSNPAERSAKANEEQVRLQKKIFKNLNEKGNLKWE